MARRRLGTLLVRHLVEMGHDLAASFFVQKHAVRVERDALRAALRKTELDRDAALRRAANLAEALNRSAAEAEDLADLRTELAAAQINCDAAQSRVRELEAELHRERTAAQQAAYGAEQAIAALRADLATACATQGGQG